MACNVGVLLQVGDFIMSCPVLKLGFVYEFEDKNFCLALFVEPKLLLIAICSRLLIRPAPLAAILLLAVVVFRPSEVFVFLKAN